MRPDEDRIITDPTEIIELDNCNILVNMAEEVSARALSGDVKGSGIKSGQIEDAFDISQRVSAEEELTGPLAIGGFGTQAEREALIDAVKNGTFSTTMTGRLDNPDGNPVFYRLQDNGDGTTSVIDTGVFSTGASGNIIGVFQQTSTGDLVFSENPDYFGGAE